MSDEEKLDTVKSPIYDIFNQIADRLRNPITLPFLISFFYLNYEIALQILFGTNTIDWAITLIRDKDKLYFSLYPLISAVGYTLIMPWLLYVIKGLLLLGTKRRTDQHFGSIKDIVIAQKELATERHNLETIRRKASTMSQLEERARKQQTENNDLRMTEGILKNIITNIDLALYSTRNVLKESNQSSMGSLLEIEKHLAHITSHPAYTKAAPANDFKKSVNNISSCFGKIKKNLQKEQNGTDTSIETLMPLLEKDLEAVDDIHLKILIRSN